ncbi:MAG: hypothetical protein QOH63_1165 [Acidobacteriota bacterium]|jgi:hypothetical protein|nr:hypothetical protein [Acidobacteriota bacterium]
MLRNNLTLLAICFALFIATVCGNQRTGNVTNALADISTNALSSSPGTPLPDTSPKTVRVRLMEVETNADVVDWPSPGSEIIIKAGATTLNKKTDENGVVVFGAVPCGQQIVITRKGGDGDNDGVFHRRLTCTRRQFDLGIIERAFGGKFILRQRKLTRMGFDATKNVWRNADGKIISMRTFNRIMAQRK